MPPHDYVRTIFAICAARNCFGNQSHLSSQRTCKVGLLDNMQHVTFHRPLLRVLTSYLAPPSQAARARADPPPRPPLRRASHRWAKWVDGGNTMCIE